MVVKSSRASWERTARPSASRALMSEAARQPTPATLMSAGSEDSRRDRHGGNAVLDAPSVAFVDLFALTIGHRRCELAILRCSRGPRTSRVETDRRMLLRS